ncbi:MAG TPA: autotransporter-associated beta strand repeat-containing protein, partial [Pirellulaceae bacterium]|nr:autotransporter-associated beta strand repeat-containing protein [Pirellulaceae bacterium]
AQDNQLGAATDVRLLGASSTLDLNGRAASIGQLAAAGGAIVTGAGILTLGGNISVAAGSSSTSVTGVLSWTNASHSIVVADGSAADDVAISASMLGGGAVTSLSKTGPGLVALAGSGSFGGAVNVNFGVVDVRNSTALGVADGTTANGTTVAAGATLRISTGSSGDVIVGNELLSLSSGALGSGTSLTDLTAVPLDVLGGANEWSGDVMMATAAAAGGVTPIQVAGGSSMKLSGVVRQVGAAPVGVRLSGAGTVEFSGANANSYEGSTYVTSGMLRLSKTASMAVPGDVAAGTALVIGDLSTGGAASVVLTAGAGEQIADGVHVSVLAGSSLALSGTNETIGRLTVQAGTSSSSTIMQAGGRLTLGGNLYVGKSGTGAVGVVIPGPINLGSASREFNVVDGAAAIDLQIDGTISGASGIDLTKQNSGTLRLPTGVTETYAGMTTANQGELIVDATLSASSFVDVNRTAT